MSSWERPIAKVYRALLACYPPEFRAEFGKEMQDVFAAAFTEGQHPDGEQPWRLFWREIRDWPGSVLQEHLRARRKEMASDGFMKGKPLPRIELLAAMIIFILPLLFPLIGILAATGVSLPKWTDYVLQILFWGAVLLPLGLALIKGFPSWSLSYLGLILMLSIILGPSDGIWGWIYPSFTQLFGPRSYWSLPIGITYAAAFEFILVSSILVSALILANLLRLLPHTRGVWQRIRADWTQLSFMCYGGLVFSVLLTLDEYQYAEIGRIMAWLCLALGAWLYLRVGGQKLRILSLICGATGAMWIVALAKWVLIPLQAWPSGYPVAPSEATRWVEAGSAMVGWVCTLLMLIAPTLLRLLPQAPDPIVSSEGDPVTA